MKKQHRAGRINTLSVGENQSQVRFLSVDSHLPKRSLNWTPENRRLFAERGEDTLEMLAKLGWAMANHERKLEEIGEALFNDPDFFKGRSSANVFAITDEVRKMVEAVATFEHVCVRSPLN